MWQPIETALKDGASILATRIGSKNMRSTYWGAVSAGHGNKNARWRGFGEFEQPTHWMPLPPPPTKDDGNE